MIKKIAANNFLSWKSLRFDVNDGVTLIDGWNEDDQTSEGSGKSAILNAISWCLYGKIPKDANIDDVIKHGEKSCEVQIQINDTMVYRSRNPNELCMGLEGGKKIKGKDARETQQMIEQFVGLSFDAFCQSVYFAQNGDKKFISSNQEARGKILSEVQDLNIFDKARKEVVALIKLETTQLSEVRHNIALERKNIELLDNQIQHELQMKDTLQKQKDGQLTSIAMQINDAKTQRDNIIDNMKAMASKLQSGVDFTQAKGVLSSENEMILQTIQDMTILIKRIEQVDSERVRIKSQIGINENSIATYKKKLDELEAFIENPTKNCPTCGTLLENCDTGHAQDEADSTRQTINLFEQNLNGFKEALAELPEDQDIAGLKHDINANEQKRKANNEQIRAWETEERNQIHYKSTIQQMGTQKLQLDDKISKLELEYQNVNNTSIVYDDSNLVRIMQTKTDTEQKIEGLSQILVDKEKHMYRLEALKSGFKDIKSYVFNSVINEINARIRIYLQQLFEVPVSLKFTNDNMKINTEATINGNNQGLGLMSGGQFRRFSLATDLAMSDVVTSRKGNKLNLLILDEYFKDLSEQSMEKCLNLLQNRKQPVLLIEHNSIFKNIIDDSYYVTYENGTSHVKV